MSKLNEVTIAVALEMINEGCSDEEIIRYIGYGITEKTLNMVNSIRNGTHKLLRKNKKVDNSKSSSKPKSGVGSLERCVAYLLLKGWKEDEILLFYTHLDAEKKIRSIIREIRVVGYSHPAIKAAVSIYQGKDSMRFYVRDNNDKL